MPSKIAKGFCLILFMGIVPSTQALTISCKHIWTVECEDCEAPMLMDCNTEIICKKSTDGTEECSGGNVKGHIKNNTVIETVHILFYIIDNNDQAKKILWNVKDFELSADHSEQDLIKSLTDTVLAETPAVQIIDWEVTYRLGISENALYKDTNAESAVLLDPDWLKALEEARGPRDIPETVYNPAPDDSILEDAEVARDDSATNGISSPPSKKIDEIEYVRKHFTGNDESYCWHISIPYVVNFTGNDKKICVIESKCINHRGEQNRVKDGEMLACAFDNETGSCPSATQCLRDATVKIDHQFYQRYPLKGKAPPLDFITKPANTN